MINESTILNLMLKAKKKAARALIRDFSEIQHLRSSKRPLEEFVKHAFCIEYFSFPFIKGDLKESEERFVMKVRFV